MEFNMKIWPKYLKLSLCLSLLLAAHLKAEDLPEDTVERVAINTHRSQHDANEFKEQCAAEDDENTKNLQVIPMDEQPEELACNQTDQEESSLLKMSTTTYVHSHPGALHYVENISHIGAALEIEDGSVWDVKGSDRNTLKLWRHHDILVLVPNRDWFSSYDFKFKNLSTGEKIRVNMFLGPIVDLQTTHWIEEINYKSRKIRLEDGTVWSMCRWDDSVLKKFEKYDVVIIGTNNGWWKGSNPNILIQVKTMKFARGNRFQ